MTAIQYLSPVALDSFIELIEKAHSGENLYPAFPAQGGYISFLYRAFEEAQKDSADVTFLCPFKKEAHQRTYPADYIVVSEKEEQWFSTGALGFLDFQSTRAWNSLVNREVRSKDFSFENLLTLAGKPEYHYSWYYFPFQLLQKDGGWFVRYRRNDGKEEKVIERRIIGRTELPANYGDGIAKFYLLDGGEYAGSYTATIFSGIPIGWGSGVAHSGQEGALEASLPFFEVKPLLRLEERYDEKHVLPKPEKGVVNHILEVFLVENLANSLVFTIAQEGTIIMECQLLN